MASTEIVFVLPFNFRVVIIAVVCHLKAYVYKHCSSRFLYCVWFHITICYYHQMVVIEREPTAPITASCFCANFLNEENRHVNSNKTK